MRHGADAGAVLDAGMVNTGDRRQIPNAAISGVEPGSSLGGGPSLAPAVSLRNAQRQVIMIAAALKNAIAPGQPMSWTEAMIVSTAAIFASIPAIAALYLVKSALGINLFAGPSPLHDVLYAIVR